MVLARGPLSPSFRLLPMPTFLHTGSSCFLYPLCSTALPTRVLHQTIYKQHSLANVTSVMCLNSAQQYSKQES